MGNLNKSSWSGGRRPLGFEGIRNKRKIQIFVACRIGHNNPNNNYMMMMIGRVEDGEGCPSSILAYIKLCFVGILKRKLD